MAEWLLIDGSSLVFRAFYGVPATIRGPDGSPNNAIRGFLDILARLVSERRPARVVVTTDADWRPEFRVRLIPEYKAHRVGEPVPPDLEPQIPIAFAVLEAAGIEVMGAPGYEAEDVIASIVELVTTQSGAPGSGQTVEIVSGDRDLFALVCDPLITVLYPEGGGRFSLVDEAWVSRRYGIPGRAYLDYAVLRGDPSDGLPGLRGIGDKKAAALIQRYGGLAGLIEASALSPAQLDYVERALGVASPVRNIPLSLREPGLTALDPDRLDQLRRRHGLDGPVQRLLQALAGIGDS